MSDELESMDEFRDRIVEEYPNAFEEDKSFWASAGNGWFGIIEDIIKKAHELDLTINIRQVKEKFGGLRFYYEVVDEEYDDNNTEELAELVREKEDESFETCEQCGTKENVETKGDSWIKTLCPTCREAKDKWNNRRAELQDIKAEMYQYERGRVRREIKEGSDTAAKYEIICKNGEFHMNTELTTDEDRINEITEEIED